MNQSASLCLMHVSVKDLLCLSVSVSLWATYIDPLRLLISLNFNFCLPYLSTTFMSNFLFVCLLQTLRAQHGVSVSLEFKLLLTDFSAIVSVSRVLSGCIRIEGGKIASQTDAWVTIVLKFDWYSNSNTTGCFFYFSALKITKHKEKLKYPSCSP